MTIDETMTVAVTVVIIHARNKMVPGEHVVVITLPILNPRTEIIIKVVVDSAVIAVEDLTQIPPLLEEWYQIVLRLQQQQQNGQG